LTAKSIVKVRGKKTSRTVPIGTVRFSIPRDHAATVKIKLGPLGRALLAASRRHLSARLAIVEVEPAPTQTRFEGVQLVQAPAPQKGHGRK
jgi:hypothetical protein